MSTHNMNNKSEKIKHAFEKIIFNTLSKLYNKFYKTDTKETYCVADLSI